MTGPESPSAWQRGSDAEVSAHLEKVLAAVLAKDDPCGRLGCAGPDDARSAFLRVSKEFHPNRFARRSESVRRLASEVFLVLKEAYEEVSTGLLDRKLAAAKDSSRKVPRARTSAGVQAEAPAREDQKERRREQLRQKLQPGTGPETALKKRPTAQIRAATVSENEIPGEEERFEQALQLLKEGKLEDASATFRQLAVARTQEKRFRMYMHYAQGRLHQREGRHDEARAEYKRALGLDASFAPALQSMSSLPDDARRKSGLFSKLFRK